MILPFFFILTVGVLEREREKGGGGGGGERTRERECVCVCVREREREREHASIYVYRNVAKTLTSTGPGDVIQCVVVHPLCDTTLSTTALVDYSNVTAESSWKSVHIHLVCCKHCVF